MKIRVLKKHIENGVIGICSACPIALAIKDATGYKMVMVSTFNWKLGRGKFFGPNPPEVTNFIDRFDGCRGVEPFTFELPVSL